VGRQESVSLREISRRETKQPSKNMYYVYFLKSKVNGDIYIGSCENVVKRVMRHNNGLVKSTKAYRPWVLLSQEEYPTRSEAMQKERYYKSGQQRELLKIRFKDMAG
jgi:putative endonuclease